MDAGEHVYTQTEQNKTFPISLFLSHPSRLASLENSFCLLSPRWEDDHLPWALVLSFNLVWAVRPWWWMIYWQIKQSKVRQPRKGSSCALFYVLSILQTCDHWTWFFPFCAAAWCFSALQWKIIFKSSVRLKFLKESDRELILNIRECCWTVFSFISVLHLAVCAKKLLFFYTLIFSFSLCFLFLFYFPDSHSHQFPHFFLPHSQSQ